VADAAVAMLVERSLGVRSIQSDTGKEETGHRGHDHIDVWRSAEVEAWSTRRTSAHFLGNGRFTPVGDVSTGWSSEELL
jgi:hypothetical protein